jgi:hypothetical protein
VNIQFLAIFQVDEVKPDRVRHFGLIVRDEKQLNEVRKKVKEKYGLKLEPAVPMRLSRSLGQSNPGGRSAR